MRTTAIIKWSTKNIRARHAVIVDIIKKIWVGLELLNAIRVIFLQIVMLMLVGAFCLKRYINHLTHGELHTMRTWVLTDVHKSY